jgi:hypothetical protein
MFHICQYFFPLQHPSSTFCKIVSNCHLFSHFLSTATTRIALIHTERNQFQLLHIISTLSLVTATTWLFFSRGQPSPPTHIDNFVDSLRQSSSHINLGQLHNFQLLYPPHAFRTCNIKLNACKSACSPFSSSLS